MNPKTFFIHLLNFFLATTYLKVVLLLVTKINKNLKHKKAVEVLGWKMEYVHHPLVDRFLKR